MRLEKREKMRNYDPERDHVIYGWEIQNIESVGPENVTVDKNGFMYDKRDGQYLGKAEERKTDDENTI